MDKSKVGFLGGTFDPIHFGHVNLALEALERLSLQEVWFCPTSISPFKIHSPPHSAKHRLKMTQLAIKGHPKFKVIKNEIFSNSPSRTYETLSALSTSPENSKKEFVLILSADLLERLSQWHQVERLLNSYSLFIGARTLAPPKIDQKLSFDLKQKIEKNFYSIRLLEISSENLRERLKKKLYCDHLCPAKVLDYIYENRLY